MSSIARLSVPLTLVGTLLIAAIGAGATYGATSASIRAAEERVSANTARISDLETQAAALRERLGRIETGLEYQNEALRRIERRLGTSP